MKILSFAVFLIAIQTIISFSIPAVNSVQSIGYSVSLPTENAVSQLVTDGEQAAQIFIHGGNTCGVRTQERLKRF